MTDPAALAADNLGLVHAAVRRYWPWLGLNGKTHPAGDYEDFVSEGTLALVKAAALFDPARGLQFSTVANVCIQHALWTFARGGLIRLPVRSRATYDREREQARRVAYLADRPELFGPCRPEAEAADEDVTAALARLPAADRRLLRWRYFEGLLLREVAAKLRITREAVRQRQAKALRRLRWCLEHPLARAV